jgi:lipoyl(octanoyl) transferase
VSSFVARDLGRQTFSSVFADMQHFTDTRNASTPDEVWFVEHDPVYTLGLNGDTAHIHSSGDIEVVATDRGGQVTYHGPGQLVAYVLFDVKRLGIAIRPLVMLLEQAVIDAVAEYGVLAHGRRDAPGVYVEDRKLGAIGLRIRRGCTYHGIAVNVNMDLWPFSQINPCGMAGLQVTQLAQECAVSSVTQFRQDLLQSLRRIMAGYSPVAES